MGTPHHITILPVRQTPSAGTGGMGLNAGAALDHGHPAVRSLYIHTPFCFHKCHYCDFYSIVDTQERQEAFTGRLIGELERLARHAADLPLRTVFVGGGTPSLLRPELWVRLLKVLNEVFDLSGIRAGEGEGIGGGEFTVECNPESATPELMGILREGGVNRVSVGAQSFNPRHLKTLERWHNPENVPKAVEAARGAGIGRQSVDLIYAVPGQTLEEWDQDLATALSLGTTHLSCYSLTYEPNTAMTARMNAGQFTPTDEDLDTDMFTHTVERLRAAGLERYEVSNFARPGSESLHNLAYWRQEQWLAAGPSASGHVYADAEGRMGGYRWKNVPRLGDYLDSEGYSPIVDLEGPDAARSLRERIMMGIRLAEGVDGGEILGIAERVAHGAGARLERAVRRFVERGVMKHVEGNGRWVLSDAGFLLTDGVAGELMECV